MCCLTSPACWNAVLMLAAPCPVSTSPHCTAGATSLQLWVSFLDLKACLHSSKSLSFCAQLTASLHPPLPVSPGMEIVTRVSVLDLEHTFPLQKC